MGNFWYYHHNMHTAELFLQHIGLWEYQIADWELQNAPKRHGLWIASLVSYDSKVTRSCTLEIIVLAPAHLHLIDWNNPLHLHDRQLTRNSLWPDLGSLTNTWSLSTDWDKLRDTAICEQLLLPIIWPSDRILPLSCNIRIRLREGSEMVLTLKDWSYPGFHFSITYLFPKERRWYPSRSQRMGSCPRNNLDLWLCDWNLCLLFLAIDPCPIDFIRQALWKASLQEIQATFVFCFVTCKKYLIIKRSFRVLVLK